MSSAAPRRNSWCPICGVKTTGQLRHRCKQSVLNAIDAARARDGSHLADPARRCEAERMAEGFRMLSDDELEEATGE